jgi:hypothetical protein
VGANWTRQTAEDSTAQTVVQDALSVIRAHYGPDGNLRVYLNADYLTESGGALLANGNNNNSILKNFGAPLVTKIGGVNVALSQPFMLQALPAFRLIPPNERAYQFGSSVPFPARNWRQCTYFWTAVARLNPMHRDLTWNGTDVTNGILRSSNYNYDIYILVFRKGAVEQTFSSPATEISGTRDSAWDTTYWTRVPSVLSVTWASGAYDKDKGSWTSLPLPGIGLNGIGVISGTVFKQVLEPPPWGAQPRPALAVDSSSKVESVIYSPPADGTAASASPLIYIYQTTMTF